jgi:Holliday junction resolvase-like predicted endonuclease
VEVKYRKAGGMTLPEDAMTAAKARSLLKAANAYISLHGIETDCRLDLVAIDAHADGTMDIRLIPDTPSIRW